MTEKEWAGRKDLLDDLSGYVTAAWESFRHPRPVEPDFDEDVLARLGEGLPELPTDSTAALADAVKVLEASVSPSRPLYLALIGSSGLEAGVLAATLAAVYDINLAIPAGAVDALDDQAVRWLSEFVGYPVTEGHFTSGGQISNLTGLLAARARALPDAREKGVGSRRVAIYSSADAHHSNIRAVETIGFGHDCVRSIPLDASRRMNASLLAERIRADVADGIIPVAVIATAGTTLTGAVDPLDAIADLCAEYNIWMHVDGAYGLPGAASTTRRHLFAGLDRADSVTVDLHKWMGLQKSCSLFATRHPDVLVRAFGHDEQYILHDQDTINPVDRTLEYSRPFRALKPWLALRLYGATQYREWIDGTIANAEVFADRVRTNPRFDLLHEPQLTAVCFRALHVDESKRDQFNSDLAAAIQKDGRLFLASASMDGHTCLRVCFVNFRTTKENAVTALEIVDHLAKQLAS